jgi:hypothetical protein
MRTPSSRWSGRPSLAIGPEPSKLLGGYPRKHLGPPALNSGTGDQALALRYSDHPDFQAHWFLSPTRGERVAAGDALARSRRRAPMCDAERDAAGVLFHEVERLLGVASSLGVVGGSQDGHVAHGFVRIHAPRIGAGLGAAGPALARLRTTLAGLRQGSRIRRTANPSPVVFCNLWTTLSAGYV